MTCPFCGHPDHKVVDSRTSADGQAIRRRRECLSCGKRFTTYEHVEKAPIMVVKKDGRREEFLKEKVRAGIMSACQKRRVSFNTRKRLRKLRQRHHYSVAILRRIAVAAGNALEHQHGRPFRWNNAVLCGGRIGSLHRYFDSEDSHKTRR